MRISDWSSDVCSSDLRVGWGWVSPPHKHQEREGQTPWKPRATHGSGKNNANENFDATRLTPNANSGNPCEANSSMARSSEGSILSATTSSRSEEHTSELQSLMRISFAVFRFINKIPQSKLTIQI